MSSLSGPTTTRRRSSSSGRTPKQTQLTVEQDELAVFFRDGKVSGVIQPGVSTLDSKEIPLLGNLVDAATGGRYFKTELYFVSTQEFANLPFGGMPRIERGR